MRLKIKSLNVHESEQGQSLVELAISFPVILLLLLGTIDFGMALYSYVVIRDSAQEGALYGSFNPGNNEGIESRARNIAPGSSDGVFFYPVPLTDTDEVKVEISTSASKCQGISGGEINSITVTTSYHYHVMMPLAGQIIGSSFIPLSASATNVILQPACP